ncbi:MAG TPA: PEP-CTERM sorting domain-containing protein [Candidatus Saccharimonadaceae bacterium]|jgi:hypothetical protein|nr:PEP-CTERM sorting domain-containing protein [Candidatus Saccharimonadaceae bacterium]
MKKLLVTLLTVTALAAMAAPSFAYVSSSLLSTDPNGTTVGDSHGSSSSGGTDVAVGANDPASQDGDDPPPTRPVPEPGTLALASMGLLALGVAGRKRQTA